MPLAEKEILLLRGSSARVPWPLPEAVPLDPAQLGMRPRLARRYRAALANWARNPIDAFLAAEYVSRGLRPAAPVASDLWLRRVYLDLIGLPPGALERQDALADHAANAREKVVERLLADPRHGRRLGPAPGDYDVFGDTGGLGMGSKARRSATATPISGNRAIGLSSRSTADKGYDRMIEEEMLAGDELAAVTLAPSAAPDIW